MNRETLTMSTVNKHRREYRYSYLELEGKKQKVYELSNPRDIMYTDSMKGRKIPQKTNSVAIISGPIIEIKQYSEPVFSNFEGKSTGKGTIKKGDVKRMDNLNKTKHSLRQLINCNVDYVKRFNNKFVTFTYANAPEGEDIVKCKDDLKKFMKRLKYHLKLSTLKYCYVSEIQHNRQKKYNETVWHFHIIFFNLPYVDFNDLNTLWGYGSTKINCIDKVDNVGAYVVKYMQKDMQETSYNMDMYGCSRGNLERPIKISTDSEVDDILYHLEQIKKLPQYESNSTSEYYGNVTYKQYNYLRNS